MKSILDSTKKAIGIEPEYDHFDPQIIMHINSAFSTLHQLGVGPEDGYSIEDKDAQWEAFTKAEPRLNSVKTYVYAKVRLAFDPPTTSFGISGLETVCKELEWRLNVASEEIKAEKVR